MKARTSTLFDAFERTDHEARSYGEPSFFFLNRCAWPAVEDIRRVLEGWFSRFPEPAASDLAGRFRSKTDSHHNAAFWELYLHELFTRLGCQLEPHPSVPGTSRRPEFLVRQPNGEPFFLEAILVTGEPDPGARARVERLFDRLRAMKSDFLLHLDVSGAPRSPLPLRRIVDRIQRELERVDHEAIEAAWRANAFKGLPKWIIKHDGWRASVSPISKPIHKRGTRGALGIISGAEWEEATRAQAIREAVHRKATRYGSLPHPFVIALNVLSAFLHRQEVLDALFGSWVVEYDLRSSRRQGPTPTREGRDGDGAFCGPPNPRNTRVAGVLVGAGIYPVTAISADLRFYGNPWTTRTAPSGALDCLAQALPIAGKIEWRDGVSRSDLFELRPNWPWPAQAEPAAG